MPRETIGNPLSWSAQVLGQTGRSLASAVGAVGHHERTQVRINRITTSDVYDALRKGAEDFGALRSDVLFAVALYPVIGGALAIWAFNAGPLHLLFPLAAGFALIGPVAAVGLYEMSRRREQGLETTWAAALSTLRGQVLGPVLTLGLVLLAIFAAWLYAAHAIWVATLGPATDDSLAVFLRSTFTTGAGFTMILVGIGVGFFFAALVLCISLVSFPMLIDRPVGVPIAVLTSLSVARRSPVATALWGLIVAVSLLVGMIPLFVGLVIVLPILGHATWHLYRHAVAFPDRT